VHVARVYAEENARLGSEDALRLPGFAHSEFQQPFLGREERAPGRQDGRRILKAQLVRIPDHVKDVLRFLRPRPHHGPRALKVCYETRDRILGQDQRLHPRALSAGRQNPEEKNGPGCPTRTLPVPTLDTPEDPLLITTRCERVKEAVTTSMPM
jgi:hypothetical protein